MGEGGRRARSYGTSSGGVVRAALTHVGRRGIKADCRIGELARNRRVLSFERFCWLSERLGQLNSLRSVNPTSRLLYLVWCWRGSRVCALRWHSRNFLAAAKLPDFKRF